MSNSGWIKIHRKIWQNPIVTKDADHFAVWIYLLTNATHTPQKALWGKEKITLQPGQLITGRKAISKKLKINESKVYRILKLFKSDQQIEQQTNRQASLITIVNWDKYQISEQQNEQRVNNERTTNEQRVNTNKNNKNKKNKKNDKNYYSTLAGKRPDGDELDAFITKERKKINGGK